MVRTSRASARGLSGLVALACAALASCGPEQPRQIIKSIPGVEFCEMIRPDWCCGMAGAFSIDHYDLSEKIAARKIDAIKTRGADILVTDCPGCQIQLADHVIRHKLPMKVMHIMELLQ